MYLGREVDGIGCVVVVGLVVFVEEAAGRRKGSEPVGEAWFEEGTVLNSRPQNLRYVWIENCK